VTTQIVVEGELAGLPKKDLIAMLKEISWQVELLVSERVRINTVLAEMVSQGREAEARGRAADRLLRLLKARIDESRGLDAQRREAVLDAVGDVITKATEKPVAELSWILRTCRS